MFFNEDLYLEDAPTGVDSAPTEMTPEEVTEEADQAMADAEMSGEEAVSEGYMLYEEALNTECAFNESYFNLREKMMNIEHIASLKESAGLVSESEMIIQEAENSFIGKLKEIFTKIKESIVKLFNRFVQFVTEVIEKAKGGKKEEEVKVGPREIAMAFDAQKNNGQGEWTANLYQIPAKDVLELGPAAEKFVKLVSNISKSTSEDRMAQLKGVARNMAKQSGASKIVASAFMTAEDNEHAGEVLVKKPTKLTPQLCKDRIDYVDKSRDVIAKTKKAKDAAVNAIDGNIKMLERVKSSAEDRAKQAGSAEYKKDAAAKFQQKYAKAGSSEAFAKKKAQGAADRAATNLAANANKQVETTSQQLAVLRESSVMINRGFSKVISVQQTFLKECKSLKNAIAARTNAVAPDVKSESTKFNFDAYFAN